MKRLLLSSFLVLFTTLSFAQLIHNTGALQVTTLPKAYIGHGANGEGGSGVVFNGTVDAMFTAGIMYGTSTSKVHGSVGSFVDANNVVLINDMTNTAPLTGFTSDPNFNQITDQVINDGASPVPLNIPIQVHSFSNTGDNFIIYTFTFTNNTTSAINNFYAGIFADWDVGATAYASNKGGYDISRKLVYQYGTTSADMKYYGFAAMTPYSGSRVTSTFPGDDLTIRDTLFSWITTNLVSTITTGADYRSYIGSGPFIIPAGGSVMASFALVVGADLAGIQTNTDLAQAKYNSFIVPVELTSFTASANNNNITLNWTTSTEINNRGFEIERSLNNIDFSLIGFINGNGTTTEARSYSFSDNNLAAGKYYYRLKQVDLNGQFEYSNVAEVTVAAPNNFSLDQNYPNPFNPSTKITYSIAEPGNVKLAVYNLLGQEVSTLVNGFKEAGSYELNFNASQLPSGTYIYKIETAQFSAARKMLLTK